MNTQAAFHGGRSFEAIGEDFRSLERNSQVVRADVLDAWFDPAPDVLDKLREFLPFLVKSSPPVQSGGLVKAVSDARDVPPECVLPGGGSSDLIFACMPRLVRERQKVLILDPMYGEYRHIFEEVIGADVVRFQLKECESFTLDVNALIRKIEVLQPDLVVIVNPNSPTGRGISHSHVLRLTDALPLKTRLLVDETYVEYLGRAESVEREAGKRTNLLVLKSMSKVYALSGMRIGYLVAVPETVRRLSRWVPPWGVSLPAQVAAVEALKAPEYYAGRYRETHWLRQQFAKDLRKISGIEVFEGCANFLLLRLPGSAAATIECMSKSDVYVRNCDSMGLHFRDRFIRITVRGAEENARVTQSIAEMPEALCASEAT